MLLLTHGLEYQVIRMVNTSVTNFTVLKKPSTTRKLVGGLWEFRVGRLVAGDSRRLTGISLLPASHPLIGEVEISRCEVGSRGGCQQ